MTERLKKVLGPEGVSWQLALFELTTQYAAHIRAAYQKQMAKLTDEEVRNRLASY